MKAFLRREEENPLLAANEKEANAYVNLCLLAAAAIAALMWLLNALGFFIVDQTSMNLAMLSGIVCLLLPYPLEKRGSIPPGRLKYVIMTCFLLGIGALSCVLTIQMPLIWACPILLSCHFYKPRFTVFTFLASLAVMLIAFYIGIYIGVWDANIMHSSTELATIAQRVSYLEAQLALGDHILLRAFNFYYLPRAVILFFAALVGITLSRRTHGLLVRQSEIVREKEQLSAELNVAAQIQSSMLPSELPGGDHFRISATMHPAKEVGGDFYDFFMVDSTHLAVAIGDVSDKGVPAALFMVIGKTLIKEYTRPGMDLGQVFTEVNRQLCESNSNCLFITAFEGVLDLTTGDFQFVNAGHEIPFLCRQGGRFTSHRLKPGRPLGCLDDTVYTSGTIRLEEGDKLFQYTDGVTEATSAQKELFGNDRLTHTLEAASSLAPAEILEAVRDAIDGFVGEAPQFDDITMLCLECQKRQPV